jgi:predicted DNA-binding protein (MmcQ/YjbR family)
MDVEIFREYCLSKPHSTESLPFDEVTLCFKVAGKIFALLSLDTGDSVNLKCSPNYAIELRERFMAVNPGFHMNKKHWNTVTFNEDIEDAMIFHLVNHSYEQVVSKLPLKIRHTLK